MAKKSREENFAELIDMAIIVPYLSLVIAVMVLQWPYATAGRCTAGVGCLGLAFCSLNAFLVGGAVAVGGIPLLIIQALRRRPAKWLLVVGILASVYGFPLDMIILAQSK